MMNECSNDLFKIQKYISNNMSKKDITFCPYEFFASILNKIEEDTNIQLIYDNRFYSKIPFQIVYNDLFLMIHQKINIIDVCKYYIENFIKYKDFKNNLNVFDSNEYYKLYYKEINEQYLHDEINTQKAAKFYCEYGYWNKLYIRYIDYLQIKCSYPIEFINISECDTVIEQYFKLNMELKFDPYIYLASNLPQLKFLITDNIIDCKRIYNHYIRTGLQKKLSINSFNHFEYLSNNHEVIKLMLIKNNKIYWDVYQLNQTNVAKYFILNFSMAKYNTFNAGKFVEMFVNNEQINHDNKLSIETAPKYFVLNYVKNKNVRYKMTTRYKAGQFINKSIYDVLRTMPYTFSKCFIDIPL